MRTKPQINTGDLQAVTPGNLMIKFADDTYIVIPAINAKQPTVGIR